MRASGFTDPAFARLAELAHLLAGLVFPPNRQPSAEAGMRRAMATLGLSDPGALLRATEVAGDARDVVLTELTVGESYFFRDAGQLDLLATEILPARVRSYGLDRPLRVWSAGCASGEEPYTLAILLRELGWPHPSRILGTDVAIARLRAARRGRFTQWALRGVSEDRVARWFHHRGTYFDLDRSVRESVEFRALNLVHDSSPTESSEHGYDLVLCRNVMIYFDLPTVARIAAGLLDSLASDGWLVLGASDPLLPDLVPCEAVLTENGVAYRRAGVVGAKARRVQPSAVEATPVIEAYTAIDPVIEIAESRSDDGAKLLSVRDAPKRGEIQDTYEAANYEAAEAMAIAALAMASETQDALALWILRIRAVANQGRVHEAGELCARALETHVLAAELHSLHATLLAEAGWHAEAATAARRSIYVDRKFVMGHLLLGDALTRLDDPAGARIAFENVVRLLSDAEPTVPIAAADGVPAARLRQVATVRLRALTAEAAR